MVKFHHSFSGEVITAGEMMIPKLISMLVEFGIGSKVPYRQILIHRP